MYPAFSYDPETETFETLISIDDAEVPVSLVDVDESNKEKATWLFDKVITWLGSNLVDAVQFAAQELTGLKNDEWLAAGEEAMTEEGFMDALELGDMTIYEDGSCTLYFHGGDLFPGHIIEVDVGADLELRQAGISGRDPA